MLLCQPCFLQYCYCCQGTETQHHCSNIYVIQFCWMKKTNCHNASNVVLPQQQRTWPMQSPATASVVAKRTIVTSGRTLAHTRTHTCTNHQVCVLPVHDLQLSQNSTDSDKQRTLEYFFDPVDIFPTSTTWNGAGTNYLFCCLECVEIGDWSLRDLL